MSKPGDEVVTKFFKRVQKDEGGCWLWGGTMDKDGYGDFSYGRNNTHIKAHRWSYEFHKRVELGHKRLVNSCSNRLCVNPDHWQVEVIRKSYASPARDLKERILSRIEVQENGCWQWTGLVNKAGYGAMTLYIDGKQRKDRVHRLSYELFKGPIPEGMHVDHLCRNRACVNPEHLEAVTPYENQVRGEQARGVRVSVWRALYRDLYKQVYGGRVTEDEWREDAKQRRKRLGL